VRLRAFGRPARPAALAGAVPHPAAGMVSARGWLRELFRSDSSGRYDCPRCGAPVRIADSVVHGFGLRGAGRWYAPPTVAWVVRQCGCTGSRPARSEWRERSREPYRSW